MLAGQTITVDVQLEQTAVEIQEITVVTQTQPLVPRDEVTTKQRIDGEFTDNLPVDRLNSVLRAAAGRGGRQPTATRSRSGAAGRRGRHLRRRRAGLGRATAATRSRGSAGTAISIGTNALEEASVTTGSSSAEFGNAQSGVISIATRPAAASISGTLGYETDEPFGVSHSLGLQPGRPAASAARSPGTSPSSLSGALEGPAVGRERHRRRERSRSSCRPASIPRSAVPSALERPHGRHRPRAGLQLRHRARRLRHVRRAAPTPTIAEQLRGRLPGRSGCRGRRASTYQLSRQAELHATAPARGCPSPRWRSQFQGRSFSENLDLAGRVLTYSNLYKPQNLTAFRQTSSVFTLNWTQNLTKQHRAGAGAGHVRSRTSRTARSTAR